MKNYDFLPAGSTISFGGRVSIRDGEYVTLSLPLSFLTKFSQNMGVKIWGDDLSPYWGHIEDGKTSKKEGSFFYPKPDGGSILNQVEEQFKKEFELAYQKLTEDKGYKPLVFRK